MNHYLIAVAFEKKPEDVPGPNMSLVRLASFYLKSETFPKRHEIEHYVQESEVLKLAEAKDNQFALVAITPIPEDFTEFGPPVIKQFPDTETM